MSICPPSINFPEHVLSKKYFKPDGSYFFLVHSSDEIKKCDSKSIGITSENVQWMEVISTELASRLGKRVLLQGTESGDQLKISEIIPEKDKESPAALTPLVNFVNLIPSLEFRVFGLEGRASYQRIGDSLKLVCRRGEKPAGLLLKKANTVLNPNVSSEIKINYQSDGKFMAGISDQRRFDKGAPATLASLPETKQVTEISNSVPFVLIDTQTPIYFSIACPSKNATLKLENFEITTKLEKNKSQRGLWYWSEALWKDAPDELLNHTLKFRPKRLFISVSMDEERKKLKFPGELRRFIELAEKQNISVWVVEGDPHVVFPDATERFVTRLSIINAFNAESKDSALISGVQYDIEPYLVKGYSLAPEDWAIAYVTSVQKLHEHANLPLEIVIPFWWQFQNVEDTPMLEKLVLYVDAISVMNYRTNATMLHLFAQPFLDWGVKHQRKVNIALELGPIKDETQWRFDMSEKGRLWDIQFDSQHVLVLTKSPVKLDRGKGYKFNYERNVSGDIVTFQRKREEFMSLLPNLEKQWSQWSSFEGVSIHGLDDLK